MRILGLILILSCLSINSCENNPAKIIRHKPVIQSITLQKSSLYPRETIIVTASVSDDDETDELKFKWESTCGSFISEINNPTSWQAPGQAGTCSITLNLSDGYFTTAKSVNVKVIER